MKHFQSVKISLCVAVAALAACSPKVENRGYMQESEIKDKVVVGQTTKDEVQSLLGSPSAYGNFGGETWYYISSREETYAFMRSEVTEQNTVRIEFDQAGVVSKVEAYDRNSGKDIDIVGRETPTEGHSMTVVEQMLGNIGRFNSPGGTGTVAPGRSGRPGGF